VTGSDNDIDAGVVKQVVDSKREEVKKTMKAGGGGQGGGEGRLLITGDPGVTYGGDGCAAGGADGSNLDATARVGSELVLLPGQKSTVKKEQTTTAIAISKRKDALKIPTPKWHAKWRISSVISGHLGWVR